MNRSSKAAVSTVSGPGSCQGRQSAASVMTSQTPPQQDATALNEAAALFNDEDEEATNLPERIRQMEQAADEARERMEEEVRRVEEEVRKLREEHHRAQEKEQAKQRALEAALAAGGPKKKMKKHLR